MVQGQPIPKRCSRGLASLPLVQCPLGLTLWYVGIIAEHGGLKRPSSQAQLCQ